MYDSIEIVKRNKMQNLVLSFLLIVFCLVNLILNIDNYKSVITGEYNIINSIKDLKNAKDKKVLFMYIDAKKAKLENYSLKSDIKVNTYKVKINNKNIMLLLKENTLLNSKVPVQLIKSDDNIIDLKSKLETKYDDKYILSDINYLNDKKIYTYKVYILLGLLFISIISVFINLMGVLNPEKTLMYKFYNRNNY